MIQMPIAKEFANSVTFPDTARMFYCIGAQKAGTTWLYQYLSRSPEVHFPPAKEVHYFDIETGQNTLSYDIRLKALRQIVETLEAQGNSPKQETLDRLENLVSLLSIHGGQTATDHARYIRYLCKGYAGQKVIADITPAYAILPKRKFSEMAEIGNAKFLFIMRDPVARMWSQIRMGVSARLGPDVTQSELQLACITHAETLIASGRMARVERADYLSTLSRLEQAVPDDHWRTIFYENLFNPKSLDNICRFLNIKPVQAPLSDHVNRGKPVKLPTDLREKMRSVFAPQYDGIRKRYGSEVPAEWRV